jgi:hypothetical protein
VAESYPNNTMVSCLTQAGVITVNASAAAGSEPAFFGRYPETYYAPGQPESITAAKAYVNGLHKAGFFDATPHIGLLYFDAPSFVDAYQRGVVPALASHGLQLTDAIPVQTAQTSADASQVIATVQNATLKFRSETIDHVIFLDASGGIANYFLTGADSQRYTPRYGLNSNTNPPGCRPTSQRASCTGLCRWAGHPPRTSTRRGSP